ILVYIKLLMRATVAPNGALYRETSAASTSKRSMFPRSWCYDSTPHGKTKGRRSAEERRRICTGRQGDERSRKKLPARLLALSARVDLAPPRGGARPLRGWKGRAARVGPAHRRPLRHRGSGAERGRHGGRPVLHGARRLRDLVPPLERRPPARSRGGLAR